MDNAAVHRFTEQVVAATGDDVDPRIKEIATSLIRHLHAFVVDVSLTLEELTRACALMVEAGRISTGGRDEFILIANILGLEVLVDMISETGGDQTTILGPMYRPDGPHLSNGASIIRSAVQDGETAYVEGFVRDEAGLPLAGATLDVWEASTNGLYDVQDPDQPDLNLRGVFTTGEDGHYAFRCLRPTPYPIPYDGPGGQLLKSLKRHPMRTAHLHFIVRAPGKTPIISQIYDAECRYMGNDAIFAIKDSLVLKFEPAGGRADTDLYARYDWRLADLPGDAGETANLRLAS
jgi:catechol 1,2-dioxygenase